MFKRQETCLPSKAVVVGAPPGKGTKVTSALFSIINLDIPRCALAPIPGIPTVTILGLAFA